jgi:hypothetical protein
VIGAVVLACAAIAVPFGLRSLDRDRAPAAASPAHHGAVSPAGKHSGQSDSKPGAQTGLGPQGDLPPLLGSGRPHLWDGARVRVGDVTDGTLRRTPGAGWQVVVRWDGRFQPLNTHGRVALGATSWVSRSGLLYTRVPTDTPGRFRVFAWGPQGGSAYTPPALVATSLGHVCFNHAFTAFGNCHA